METCQKKRCCVQVGVVEALTTIEYEVQLTLGYVRRQPADKEGAHFFLGGCRCGCIGHSGGRCGGDGVGFEAGQLGERHDVERLWKEKQTEYCDSGMVSEKCESKKWQNMIARPPYLTGATETVQGGCEGPCECGG